MDADRNLRKNINISIQSKKYNQKINDVLNDWENNGLNLSTQVCDTILMGDKIENSATLLGVIKMHSLLEVILELNGVSKDNLEKIFSKLVVIKGEEISKILSNEL